MCVQTENISVRRGEQDALHQRESQNPFAPIRRRRSDPRAEIPGEIHSLVPFNSLKCNSGGIYLQKL